MRAIALVLLLSACGTAPEAPRIWRDPAVPIASKADFDAARFAGRWHHVARFPEPGGAACPDTVTDWAAAGDTMTLRRSCDGEPTATGTARVAPLGRLRVTQDGTTTEKWVLWADDGYRTAVLVRADGRGGAILDRTPRAPVDRLRAAIEVLDFNGFDTDALVFGNTP
ncbi:lipocalin family protein [Jannaschia rubra]|uniref:Bacterial lipocalin n=1 Tax=Jannaschia rubra TaxID=282197 RepID=A0A0M6XUF1_9RHOB|nr:lipocalin family protein [Jannaschia rubra]CTQ33835.1 Bacterial lipocalin [Jannaschia rubra]SFG10350.1 apolipoprotein D and lipocalin family protein [Jannaschia rubra]